MGKLPECNIVRELVAKNDSKINQDLDYIKLLEGLRDVVSIEVSRINELFPEYTPHDENYHLKRLFFIADELLGDNLINQMNATELFLLAVSLYAHDWGMAISVEEKNIILNSESKNSERFCLLDDEYIRIIDFCKDREVTTTSLSTEHWREYVRLTHAFRSGKRIRRHFETINLGIADYACRICEGHWLDFNIIEDYTSYPTNASINRDVVNVKALTLYVRLVDLLDLGEDRTPFILWKFVAPRNSFSKMEWQKHRCLQPVTFPKYQNGRYIQVDGSTDDHNVYMSIKDMERYINDQFRLSSDIINRMNHIYHKLDISHISWRIAATGFKPIAVQFEFERNRMFDILGDDIYNGNPYVFVRELLQNAIDAIQMRIEILNKFNDVTFFPRININIEEDSEKYIVQVSDNGIGMDEYIIKNYLAVAGRSYYKSSDFRKEGVEMDPISRFGIGILSCFMVADYIEIETRKDPNMNGESESLRISIPAKENYFKISRESKQINPGTTFRVFVLKGKLPKDSKTNLPLEMNFSDYVSKVAAYCKFPITIKEKQNSITVINPNCHNHDKSNTIQQLSYSFPFDKAILPQYVNETKEYFEEKLIHFKKDLGLDVYDGCITYILPKNENIDIINIGHIWPVREVCTINLNEPNLPAKKIKWNENWISFRGYSNNDGDMSDKSYNVYIDGIYITDITPPNIDNINKKQRNDARYYYSSLDESFVSPQLNVNMSKPSGMKIDLARTRIKTDEKWDIPIWNALLQYIKNNIISSYYDLECKDRLWAFARLLTFYKIPSYILINNLINPQCFPLLYLSKDNKIKFIENNSSDLIRLIPNVADYDTINKLYSYYAKGISYSGILDSWNGEDVVVGLYKHIESDSLPCSLKNMLMIHSNYIFNNYYFYDIEFVTSTLGKNYPLVSEVLHLKLTKNNKVDDTDVYNYNLDDIDQYQLSCLRNALKKKFNDFPKLVRFPTPYQNKVFFSCNYLNFNNEFSKSLIRVCSIIASHSNSTLFNLENAILLDLANDIPFISRSFIDEREISISEINASIEAFFDKAFTYGITSVKECFTISLDDFVPHSVLADYEANSCRFEFNPKERYFNENCEWGTLIE